MPLPALFRIVCFFRCWKTTEISLRCISQVFLCFDSDEPGQSAARRIDDKLFTMGIKSQILVPNQKDWNEDLVCLKSESEVMEPCQSIGL